MSLQERKRRRQQSERDREAEQLRRDRGLHDEARLSPKMAARLPTGAVAARYGVTTRSVDRWWKDPDLNFPQPIIVNERKYWALTDLEIWERGHVAEKVHELPGGINRLLADIATAPDEAYVVGLITNNLNAIAALPPREREHISAAIQDAVRERRACDEDR
jgi:hypothetical protein